MTTLTLRLWHREGDGLASELYVDTRMPRVEEEHTNLWNLGNMMLSSAREIIQNHE